MSAADGAGRRALVNPWLGEDYDIDFEFRPGELTEVDAEDVEAARRFRDVLGRFASGVVVVTGLLDEAPVGMTCQSFASVSLIPPLVLFCPARTSLAWPRIQQTGGFAANLLAADQADLSRRMGSRRDDKFDGVVWRRSAATGSPLLGGVIGYVDCTIHAVHEAGDHFIVVGRVLDLDGAGPTDALTYYRGRYGRTGE